ncbi:hypothetical protein CN093_08755 [Sinorhizobium meliloti]|jgi:hypothetical protein|uniref:hypothetical protein n=1 Tax=Rhizobium meliloti TaxID=382 RepID=UPI000FD2DA93|nr:hypothetical protein [Sinorhizobium meliloti]RVO41343.1 hypothetical protein CN093_08755 [Sinorhizobium meliloti]
MDERRSLPDNFALRAAKRALNEGGSIASAFIWSTSDEGHEFWSNQHGMGLTDEGRAALSAYIATAEAELAAAA